MTNFSKITGKALAVLVAVVCITLLSDQFAKDLSESITSDEPTIAAANPPDAQSWTVLADIEKARFESTVVQYQDDLYVFNGFGIDIDVEPTVEKFDAGTQTWSVIGQTSISRGNAVTHNGVIRNGNEVWIIGGRVGDNPGAVTSKVWKFNLGTYAWSEGPQLPVPVAAGGAALVDNRIHWFGGLDSRAQCDVSHHYVYDLGEPLAGWTDISSTAAMPVPRNHFATVVHDGLIYAIGGQFTHDGCGIGTPDTDLVHVFDPETNYWTQKASMPDIQSHTEPSTFVHKGAIYVVGGATRGNKVFRYDPSTDIWDTVADLPQALLAPIARVIDGELIVSSGGAPSINPSKTTYVTDMTPLLLPAAGNTDTNANSDGVVIADSFSPPITGIDSTSDTGLIVLEAEFHDSLTGTASHKWEATNLAGASDNVAMAATPDTNSLAKDSNGSPSMGYFAYFDSPGTWYLWVRGWGDTVNGEGRNDSLHAGLNGSLSATADKIDNFPPGWNWTNNTRDGVRASLKIPSAGIHVVNLWMREDGLSVDKILLTTDSNYQPSGIGPSQDTGSLSASGGLTNGDAASDNGTLSNVVDIDVDDVVDVGVDEAPPEDTSNGTVQEMATLDNAPDISGAITVGIQSINGIVAIEIENFDTANSASNKQWVRSDQSGASGNASMVTTPDTGVLKLSNLGSPVMNYPVHFSEAGTYTVWLRGWGDTVGTEGKSDSVHVGINGVLNSAAAIQNFPPGWHWSSDKRSGGVAILSVPSSGLHTINIWMREDGLILDKLVLASNATYTPTGQGPAVTSVEGGTPEDGLSIVEPDVITPETNTADIPAEQLDDPSSSEPLVGTSASDNSGDARLAIDRNPATRWTTRTRQRAGQWFQLDLGSVQSVSSVVLDSENSTNDQPATYSLSTSLDGRTFTVAARGSGAANGKTRINFSSRPVRFIRITQTGSKVRNWWSIHEIDVAAETLIDVGDNTEAAVNENTPSVVVNANWLEVITADNSSVDARHEAGGVAFNGKLYVIGGRGNRAVNEYSPDSNKWTRKSAAPVELNHFQPVVYGNKIWILGAFTGRYPNEVSVTEIYTYTPSTDKWDVVGNIPAARRRGSAGTAVHNGLIYIVGGNTNGHNEGAKPWLDSYNPANGQWKVLPDAPSSRDHLTAAISNGKLIVAGGRKSAYPNTFGNLSSGTDIYDFNTAGWTTGKQIPTKRAGTMAVTVGDEIIVIGGETVSQGTAHKEVEAYNVLTNSWRELESLNTGRHSGAAAVVDNKIHVVSGSERRGGSPESEAHETLAIDF